MIVQILKHKNKILALGDQVVVSGTNFTVGILITRFIGIDGYGRFALYWMVYLFLQGLCNAFIGLPAQVLSNSANNKDNYLEQNNRLGKMLLIGIIIVLYPSFYIYDAIMETSFGFGYWLFPLVIVLFLKQEMNRKYFYAKSATFKVLLIDCCAYLLQLPALLLLVANNSITLNSVLLVFTCTGLISQIVFFYLKAPFTSPYKLASLPIRQNWNYAKHLIFTSVLQWFSGNFILISAGSIIGIGAVGIIRVLQNIMGVLHVLFLTLENVIPVKASMLLNQHSKTHMFTYFKKVTLVSGIAYGLILLALKLFGSQILELLYGASYVEYAYLLDLFIAVYILIFLGTIAQLVIKTLQLNQGIFHAYLLTVIIAFLVASPLLNTFDIKGVILGFGLLQTVTLIVYSITIKRALS